MHNTLLNVARVAAREAQWKVEPIFVYKYVLSKIDVGILFTSKGYIYPIAKDSFSRTRVTYSGSGGAVSELVTLGFRRPVF